MGNKAQNVERKEPSLADKEKLAKLAEERKLQREHEKKLREEEQKRLEEEKRKFAKASIQTKDDTEDDWDSDEEKPKTVKTPGNKLNFGFQQKKLMPRIDQDYLYSTEMSERIFKLWQKGHNDKAQEFAEKFNNASNDKERSAVFKEANEFYNKEVLGISAAPKTVGKVNNEPIVTSPKSQASQNLTSSNSTISKPINKIAGNKLELNQSAVLQQPATINKPITQRKPVTQTPQVTQVTVKPTPKVAIAQNTIQQKPGTIKSSAPTISNESRPITTVKNNQISNSQSVNKIASEPIIQNASKEQNGIEKQSNARIQPRPQQVNHKPKYDNFALRGNVKTQLSQEEQKAAQQTVQKSAEVKAVSTNLKSASIPEPKAIKSSNSFAHKPLTPKETLENHGEVRFGKEALDHDATRRYNNFEKTISGIGEGKALAPHHFDQSTFIRDFREFANKKAQEINKLRIPDEAKTQMLLENVDKLTKVMPKNCRFKESFESLKKGMHEVSKQIVHGNKMSFNEVANTLSLSTKALSEVYDKKLNEKITKDKSNNKYNPKKIAKVKVSKGEIGL